MIKRKKLAFVFISLFFSLNIVGQKKLDVFSTEIHTKKLQTNCLEIFKLIKEKGVKLTYSSNDFDFNRKITLSKNNYKLKELLEIVTSNTDVRIVKIKEKIILTSQQSINNSDKITISGFIKEDATKEVLIGATILVKGTNKGAIANSYGFYSLSLPRKKHLLEISFVGFEKQKIEIDLTKNSLTKNFYLVEENLLATVIINANPNNQKKNTKSDQRITKKGINEVPMLLGENDPLKSLKLSAGVSGGMDSNTSLNVRSGNSDENLILIDGTPVYNHNHLGGIASIFNTNVIKHIDVHRGRFPSKYNGRLSSVIDIRTKDGHMTEYHGSINLSPVSFSLTGEGPIKKNKASFITSFRRSVLLELVNKVLSGDPGASHHFYDYNFKANYLFNNSDRIFLSAYMGEDNLEFDNSNSSSSDTFNLNLGNQLVSFKWNHIYNPKTFQHLSITYSNFKGGFLSDFFDRSTVGNSNIKFKTANRIKDISLNNDVEYFASEKLKTNFGVNLKFIEFTNNTSKFNPNKILASSSDKNQSFHLSAYAENNIKFNNQLLLKAGVNITNYFLPSKTYNYFLPRLSFFYTPNNKHTFFSSFNSISQFNHEITSTFSFPNDLKAPSTKKTPPKKSTLFEVGYIYDLNKKDYFSVKGYYKKVDGVIIYRPGQYILTNNVAMNWEDRFLYGKGIRKGIECEVKKHLGKKLKTTLNYTFSSSDNSFDEINEGKYFPSAFDFRHMLNASMNFYVNNRISLNSTLNYSTGKRINIPIYRYTNFDDAIDVTDSGVLISLPAALQVSSLNTRRLPNNYSFNVGATYKKKFKNSSSLQINAGIYNLFGNTPPVFLNPVLNNNKIRLEQKKMKKYIPYLNISYEF